MGAGETLLWRQAAQNRFNTAKMLKREKYVRFIFSIQFSPAYQYEQKFDANYKLMYSGKYKKWTGNRSILFSLTFD